MEESGMKWSEMKGCGVVRRRVKWNGVEHVRVME